MAEHTLLNPANRCQEEINMLSDRLRKAIDDSGLQYSEVAKRAGITPAYLSQLLTKIRKNPSRRIVNALASELGVEGSWLLSGTGPMRNENPQQEFPDGRRGEDREPRLKALLDGIRQIYFSGDEETFTALEHNLRIFMRTLRPLKAPQKIKD